jgi:hypothetical protein
MKMVGSNGTSSSYNASFVKISVRKIASVAKHTLGLQPPPPKSKEST